MSDLVEFLRARLDEDSVAALILPSHPTFADRLISRPFLLAEVEAKRRIIERWEHATRDPDDFEEQWGLEWAMRALAQPYAGHPDFDPEWKL
jgi:hypothetical protein